MTAKEVLNLIDWLRQQGFDNDKVVECIEAVEGKKEYGGDEENEGDQMGMTDKQFNGFVRFLLDDIEEVIAGMEESKEKEKLKKVAKNLQKTLED